MKLVVLLSMATLVACDYSAPHSETPTDAYAAPDKIESIGETSAPVEPAKPFFGYNVYKGAFPPNRFLSSNFFSSPSFYSFDYPFKAVNFANPPQGILPPQISQIVPPQFSQIVPPIFGNNNPVFPAPSPAFPAPSPSFPSQGFPSLPQPIPSPLFNKFTFSYYSPPAPHLYPHAFNLAFPSSFASPPSPSAPSQFQKQPSNSHPESLSTSYGPPATSSAEPEPAGAIETSAPFEPSPVSYPYEPAAPEEHETSVPHTPAQEYGPPSVK